MPPNSHLLQTTVAEAGSAKLQVRRRLRRAAKNAVIEMLEPRQLLSAGNLTIVPTYDSSITTRSDASTVEKTIQAAIDQIEGLVTTNSALTVTIDFQDQNSGLGGSTTPQQDIPYSTYLADLEANSNKSANDIQALSTMPAGPITGINGASMVSLTAANLDAIGDTTDAASALSSGDGFYGDVFLNLSSMNVSRPGTNPNDYDMESTAMHEIDEVLGIGGNGTTLYQPGNRVPSLPSDVGPLDFFRYSSSGVRSFTYSDTATAYFSINGGNTPIVYFNQDNGAGGADFGDWDDPQNDGNGNNPPQVQDAYGSPGIASVDEPNMGKSELTALDVVGYNLITNTPTAPIIAIDPKNQSAGSGATVTFTAAASGTPTPTVQWQVSVSGGEFADISGATSTTLTITAPNEDGNQYQAVFTNSQGTATTNAATLTIIANSAPVVAANPMNQSVLSNGTATFTADATGYPVPSVQWQVSAGGGAFTDISGATATTLNLQATTNQNGNQYRAVFTNSLGTATTTAATLAISTLSAPVVVTNPTNQNGVTGTTATFTAAVTGTPTPGVQWQVRVSGGNYSNIAGATSSTLMFTVLSSDNANQYRAVYTNSQGTAITSVVTLTVVAPVAAVVTTNPTNQNVVNGATATFTAAATGIPTPTVQWQVSVNGGAFANIAGATSTTLSVVADPSDSGNEYHAVFTNSISTVTTTAATLAIVPPLNAVITAPAISAGGGSDELISVTYTSASAAIDLSTLNGSNLTVTGPGSSSPLSGVSFLYNTGSGDSITATYSIPAPDGSWQSADNGTYAVTVKSGAGSVTDDNGTALTAASTSFTVNASTDLVLNVTTSAGSVSMGQPVVLTATLSGSDAGGASGNVTFYDNGTEIAGSPVSVNASGQAIFSVPSLAAGSYYITASYSGDSTHPAVLPQSTLQQTIAAQPLSVTPSLKGGLPKQIVFVGQATRIGQTLIIKNGSTMTFADATGIALYLATGSAPGSDLVSLPASVASEQLDLKTLRSKSFHIQSSVIPASTPPGQYYILAMLTGSSGQTSMAASARTITVATPRSDLAAALVGVPTTEKIGHSISATLIVTNNGNIPAVGPLLIDLYSSPDETLDQSAVALSPVTKQINIKPGKSTRIHLGGIVLSSTAYLIAKIDPNNAFNDVDLSNNVAVSIQVAVG